jgi:hypothetical protein
LAFLSALYRLAGKHVSSAHTVPPGRVFFLGATETVEVSRYAYVLKPQVA